MEKKVFHTVLPLILLALLCVPLLYYSSMDPEPVETSDSKDPDKRSPLIEPQALEGNDGLSSAPPHGEVISTIENDFRNITIDDDSDASISSSAHVDLALQYYEQNNLEMGVFHLNEALRIDPGNAVARNLLPRLTREERVEKGFYDKEGSHFVVKYEGGQSDVAGHTVLLILETAYKKVGADLDFYPDDMITVVLYSSDQFRDVTRSPSWAGGLYDGKIRIPVGGVRERTDALEKVIYHEYTHALIHRMGEGRMPTWLNEGIAQYQEDRTDDREKTLRDLASVNELMPLGQLEGSFMGMDQSSAWLAYAESLSAASYIIDEYGMGMIERLVISYKDGRNSELSMKELLRMSFKEFQDGWVRNLKRRYGS